MKRDSRAKRRLRALAEAAGEAIVEITDLTAENAALTARVAELEAAQVVSQQDLRVAENLLKGARKQNENYGENYCRLAARVAELKAVLKLLSDDAGAEPKLPHEEIATIVMAALDRNDSFRWPIG